MFYNSLSSIYNYSFGLVCQRCFHDAADNNCFTQRNSAVCPSYQLLTQTM